MRPRLFLLFAAICALGTGQAPAQEFSFASTDLSPSGLSGTGSVSFNLQANVTRNSRVYGVMWGERSDDPCHLELRYERLETGSRTGRMNSRRCHNNANRSSSNNSSRRSVDVPVGRFVTGMQVCMNSGNNKIKGIRLFSEHGACVLGENVLVSYKASENSYLSQGGFDYTLSSDTPSIQITCDDPRAVYAPFIMQANCNNRWDNRVNCPSGQVASGFQVSARAGSNGRSIVQGLGLLCRELARAP